MSQTPEEKRAWQREYDRTHREQKRAWRKKNRDRENARARERNKERPRKRTPEDIACIAAWQKTHRQECNDNKARCLAKDPERAKEYRDRERRYEKAHPERILLQWAKSRAKKKGLDFNIEESDIHIPEVCPVLGIPLFRSDTPGKACRNSPTLDRIDSTKGYIKGNVWVISHRANHIKLDASLEELEALVAALKAKLQK